MKDHEDFVFKRLICLSYIFSCKMINKYTLTQISSHYFLKFPIFALFVMFNLFCSEKLKKKQCLFIDVNVNLALLSAAANHSGVFP